MTLLSNNSQKKGLATVVVIILLGVMSMLLVVNTRSLSQLKRHLDLVEQRQKQKFEAPIVGNEKIENKSTP